MGKQAKQREDWWVIARPPKREGGEPKEIGPLTHRAARATAYLRYCDGWRVVLQRRDVHGKKLKEIEPQFPGVKRAV